ncbi:hypothetical protein EDD99_8155 [Streptomyces sp. 846.5]|nr:hypothetical protein [Streptomyces sp. 846.5]TDT93345.1 hypothetical protein EDD99_8155 [Streptomyces sp. 846.5]
MLDPEQHGFARELPRGEHLPQNYTPVVVVRSTAYGLHCAGALLQAWHPQVPRPYLVIVADAPLRPPTAVRFRTRALSGRTLGTVHVPYLVQLRSADDASDALSYRPVAKAARLLRSGLGLNLSEKG